jgi:hypothetical protein
VSRADASTATVTKAERDALEAELRAKLEAFGWRDCRSRRLRRHGCDRDWTDFCDDFDSPTGQWVAGERYWGWLMFLWALAAGPLPAPAFAHDDDEPAPIAVLDLLAPEMPSGPPTAPDISRERRAA